MDLNVTQTVDINRVLLAAEQRIALQQSPEIDVTPKKPNGFDDLV